VGFSETGTWIGVEAEGTAWVEPKGAVVMWVDAAAVGEASREALKTLARRGRLVYLVASDVEDYVAVRRRVAASGCPAGPAVWLRPTQERGDLVTLHQTWPHVERALVCSASLAQKVETLQVKAWRVPRADGGPAEAGGDVRSWADVVNEGTGSAIREP